MNSAGLADGVPAAAREHGEDEEGPPLREHALDLALDGSLEGAPSGVLRSVLQLPPNYPHKYKFVEYKWRVEYTFRNIPKLCP